uniref:Putative ribonuclease H-like domain-containing protein n=1 Tax=Tanacetum cinerariifolium TaxID=118510 RepID=A0A6L2JRA9_TANCI|nr:putative ribonuclease H-like domain-containing protein [Tanacetum cinerariifolium]
MLENRENVKSRSDKGYHAVPPPYTGNYIPPKPDLTFIDEQVESDSMDVVFNVASSDVKTVESKHESVDVKNKGVYSTIETKHIRNNNFSPPIIEDWNSNDESEVEFIPKVEVKTVRPSIEKIKFVKSAREKVEKGNPHQKEYKEKGVIDSGCSRNMTGNKCYLIDYEDYDGGFVFFGDGKGRISGKGKIRTGTLDFDDVYFCKELNYNLFSVSQMCDKKNNVLFTDTECLVLSSKFKLLDESQVLLRVPRKDNIYSVDLKSVVPTGGLTCLFAKDTIDESNLWHRRLEHINYKTINKLVKGKLVRGLPLKIFENAHGCVACQKGKQHKASCKVKLVNSISKPLHMLHMDLFGPTNVKSLMKKSYCLVITDDFSRFSWVFFFNTKDETSGILKTFITGIENQLDCKVKVIRCDNGTEFKSSVLNQFCDLKGIKREFSVARTPQQNGVAKRKNRTLIDAARTMIVDSKLPTTFWAEAVNTSCYVLNRDLVIKPQNKTPYELIHGRPPLIDFMKPFGCPVIILNTRDHLGKFDGKADEGFFVGYSVVNKAMRVFNKRTRIVEETLNIKFLENAPNVKRNGLDWLFDIDSLIISMNNEPVVAGKQTNGIAGTKDKIVACQAKKKKKPKQEYILIPICTTNPLISQGPKDSAVDAGKKETEVDESRVSDNDGHDDQVTRSEFEGLLQQERQTGHINNTNSFNTVSSHVSTVGPSFANTASPSPINAAGTPASTNAFEEHPFEQFSPFKNTFSLPHVPIMTPINDIRIFDNDYDDEVVEEKVDIDNVVSSYIIPDAPLTKFLKDHPKDQVIGSIETPVQTRHMTKINEEHDKWAIGTKWVFRNKKDERGIVVKNKARLVAQGHTQEEGIDYDEVFAPVARIKAIRLFLAYASIKNFLVYQIDVKSAFLYGKIEEEVYVCQPPGFEDPDFPDKVNKVKKLFMDYIKPQKHVQQNTDEVFISQDKYMADILKKFEFSTVKTTSTPIEPNKALVKDAKAKNVDVHLYRLMINSLMYLTDSRSDIKFAVCACARFQVTPKTSHLHAMKRIFRYLKGQPKLVPWYLRDSPFDLEAYSNSDYAGASLDRKSTTGDGNVKLISEASIKRHLKLEDSDGISSLPNTEIFEQHALIGPKKTAWEQFSSNIATLIICLATNRTFNFSKMIFEGMHKRQLLPNKRTYVPPTLTQKLFSNMRRASKGYTGMDIPLFPTMLVQGLQGEGATIPIESHHTPLGDPKILQPPLSSPYRVPTSPHDSPLPGGHTRRSDKGSLTLNELTVLWKTVKTRQARRRAKIVISDDDMVSEDSSKQRRMIEDIDQDVGVILVTPTKVSSQEDQPEDQLGVLSAAKILAYATRVYTYSRRRRAVSTGRGGVSTASKIISTAEETVSTAGFSIPVSTASMVEESTSSPRVTRDKGKGFRNSSKATRRNYATKRQRMAQVHQAAQTFIKDEWKNIRERVEANEELTQKLQAEERDKYRAGGSKRDAEKELDQGSSKKQKTDEASGSVQEQPVEEEKELSQKDLQDNLDQLWSLVKERFSSTKPSDDKDRVLWVELKRLFEPDADDEL